MARSELYSCTIAVADMPQAVQSGLAQVMSFVIAMFITSSFQLIHRLCVALLCAILLAEGMCHGKMEQSQQRHGQFGLNHDDHDGWQLWKLAESSCEEFQMTKMCIFC